MRVRAHPPPSHRNQNGTTHAQPQPVRSLSSRKVSQQPATPIKNRQHAPQPQPHTQRAASPPTKQPASKASTENSTHGAYTHVKARTVNESPAGESNKKKPNPHTLCIFRPWRAGPRLVSPQGLPHHSATVAPLIRQLGPIRRGGGAQAGNWGPAGPISPFADAPKGGTSWPDRQYPTAAL